jgi:hypothetical protein
MNTVKYTKIDTSDLNISESAVILQAKKIGYNMVKFEGFSGYDFGNSADIKKFPKNPEIKINQDKINDILTACATLGENAKYISIFA